MQARAPRGSSISAPSKRPSASRPGAHDTALWRVKRFGPQAQKLEPGRIYFARVGAVPGSPAACRPLGRAHMQARAPRGSSISAPSKRPSASRPGAHDTALWRVKRFGPQAQKLEPGRIYFARVGAVPGSPAACRPLGRAHMQARAPRGSSISAPSKSQEPPAISRRLLSVSKNLPEEEASQSSVIRR